MWTLERWHTINQGSRVSVLETLKSVGRRVQVDIEQVSEQNGKILELPVSDK